MRLNWLRFSSTGFAAALGVAVVAPASGAFACDSDADCGPGSHCTTETGQSCYGGGYAGEEPYGAEWGHDAGSSMDVVCEPYEYTYCAPLDCEQDADCGESAVCQTWSYTECDWSDSACPPGFPCPWGPAEPTNCREVSESECLPRSEAPCQVDEDCGAGFDCEYGTDYFCEGSDGSTSVSEGAPDVVYPGSPEDAGAPMPLPPSVDGGSSDDWNCTSQPSEQGYCALRDLPCEDDAACPEGMSCHERYTYDFAGCGGPVDAGGDFGGGSGGSTTGFMAGGGDFGGGSGGSTNGGMVGYPDAGSPCELPEPTVTHVCEPTHWNEGPGGPVIEDGGGTGGMGTGGVDAGIGESDGGAASPTTGGGEAGSNGSNGGHDGKQIKGLIHRLLGGCSARPGAPADASWLFVLVVLGGLALRRRSRRDQISEG